MPSVDLKRARLFAWKVLSSLPEHTLSVRTEHGRFSFSSRDHEIGRKLFLTRNFDFEKIQHAHRLLARLGYLSGTGAGYLVDVGANVGTVCIPLVRDGFFSRALAFEPEPRNHSLLVKNIRKNKLAGSIKPFNCALSSSESTLQMELSADNYGDHRVRTQDPSLSPSHEFTESSRRLVSVRACRLDEMLPVLKIKPQDISLLWLDVQGHEKHVLAGAESVVRAGRPVVAEFWPYGLSRSGVTPEIFTQFISSRFTAFYDLNSNLARRQASNEVGDLFAAYKGTSFTDLLLVND